MNGSSVHDRNGDILDRSEHSEQWLLVAFNALASVDRVGMCAAKWSGMSDLSDQIALDAVKAASISNDGVTVARRSLADQIAADRYARDVAAAASPAANFRNMISQIVPGGGPQ